MNNSTEQLAYSIARYAFEHDAGDIDAEFCAPEILSARCLVDLFRKMELYPRQ